MSAQTLGVFLDTFARILECGFAGDDDLEFHPASLPHEVRGASFKCMSDVYETDKLLAEYLLFHYGSADEVLPAEGGWPAGMQEALDFAVRTVSHFSQGEVGSSLDLGCAVGRSSFELARTSKEVIGIDFSANFIAGASTLAAGEAIAKKT